MLRIIVMLSIFSFVGCTIKPISRIEYGRNDFIPKQETITTEYVYTQGGVRIQKNRLSVDLMAGPIASWTEYNEDVGVNINPRIFYFFDSATFLHLEVDYSVYHDFDNIFTFLAIEKVW